MHRRTRIALSIAAATLAVACTSEPASSQEPSMTATTTPGQSSQPTPEPTSLPPKTTEVSTTSNPPKTQECEGEFTAVSNPVYDMQARFRGALAVGVRPHNQNKAEIDIAVAYADVPDEMGSSIGYIESNSADYGPNGSILGPDGKVAPMDAATEGGFTCVVHTYPVGILGVTAIQNAGTAPVVTVTMHLNPDGTPSTTGGATVFAKMPDVINSVYAGVGESEKFKPR